MLRAPSDCFSPIYREPLFESLQRENLKGLKSNTQSMMSLFQTLQPGQLANSSGWASPGGGGIVPNIGGAAAPPAPPPTTSLVGT